MACSAALTGHLVLSTLHTIDSSTAFSRLIDLGVKPKQISSAVLTIVAQRLVRRICKKCERAYKPSEQELDKLGLRLADLGEETRFHYGVGCKACHNTGYAGRAGLYEVLLVQSDGGHLQKAIEAGASTSAIRMAARKDGMKTLRAEGIEKILEGKTTAKEVLRVTQDEVIGMGGDVSGADSSFRISGGSPDSE